MLKPQRRNSPTLTYNRQHGLLLGQSPVSQQKDEKSFLYLSLVFGTVLLVACVYASVNEGTTPWRRRKLAKQLDHIADHMRHRRLSSSRNNPIQLQYNPPKPREATAWTLDEFFVNGVNLAQYGFEEEFPTKITLEGVF